MKPVQLIYAGWLIDGSGSPVQKNVVMKLYDGKISSLSERMPFPLESAFVTDLSSCTVLPGLIDSHVHLIMSGTLDDNIRTSQLNMEFEDAKPIIFPSPESTVFLWCYWCKRCRRQQRTCHAL